MASAREFVLGLMNWAPTTSLEAAVVSDGAASFDAVSLAVPLVPTTCATGVFANRLAQLVGGGRGAWGTVSADSFSVTSFAPSAVATSDWGAISAPLSLDGSDAMPPSISARTADAVCDGAGSFAALVSSTVAPCWSGRETGWLSSVRSFLLGRSFRDLAGKSTSG